jgi:hypothetical protein
VDNPTKRWTGFVHRQEREVLSRREKHGLSLSFAHAELVTLMREIQAFGVAARKDRHATTQITTMLPTHALVQGSKRARAHASGDGSGPIGLTMFQRQARRPRLLGAFGVAL